jgi:uncharacterized protein
VSEDPERQPYDDVDGVTIPPVVRDDASAVFFDAMAIGRLSLRSCERCRTLLNPSARSCTTCYGDVLGDSVVANRGRLISWVVVHEAPTPVLADSVPYVVGIVEVEGGAWMIARIVCAGASLHVGSGLVVRFVNSGSTEAGEVVPVFVVA